MERDEDDVGGRQRPCQRGIDIHFFNVMPETLRGSRNVVTGAQRDLALERPAASDNDDARQIYAFPSSSASPRLRAKSSSSCDTVPSLRIPSSMSAMDG
jgi:hypothetical protein